MVMVTGIVGVAALATVSTATAATSSATSTPAFTQTETIDRNFRTSTGTTTVATNTVTLDVGQTTSLEGRQEIAVSWSGAHPTGGIVADQNSTGAQYEEYPFVLLQCRGDASQVSPEACWTQSANERYQESNTSDPGGLYPPYRLDEYSSTHGAVVGRPSTLPTTTNCKSTSTGRNATPVQYWVPWDAAGGTVYDGGTGGFCGEPPEANDGITSALPSNETFGVTGSNGTGSAEFDVFTSAENGTLGCSQTVTCSLVAVPIMGISCDATALPASSTPSVAAQEATDLAVCEQQGAYSPGSSANTTALHDGADLTVTGSLWWSPSNWNDRITVPLTFAPLANTCSVVNPNSTVSVYGSTLMLQATDQWEPAFCTGDKYNFSFVQVTQGVGEPEARNLVATGGADAAFTSYAQPGGYGKPVVNAPVGVTGFTISYQISGANGEPYTDLKLTPLLLAKLLTNSYPVFSTSFYEDPALAQNPPNITDTPEFIALNPGITQKGNGAFTAAELVSLSSDSDVMEALTTYINDTPAARAFLNGTPDTSMPGEDMVVNPAYKGIQLPVDQWPLLSTYESTKFDNSPTHAACLANAPEPFFSLVAAPLASLEDVSEAMQFEKPNSTTVCSSNSEQSVNSLVAGNPQSAGNYFMIGITPLADDQRYSLQAAALQTTSGTFVTPSDTSLQAATSLLTPDTATGTWPIPYPAFRTTAGASAYPGTMVVYAAVPTSGLPAGDAADYASLLQFAATTGQTPGSGVGQLPTGYLPLTQADGLGALVNYTEAAAADVAAQNGQVPPLTSSSSTGPTTPSLSASPAASAGSTTSSSTAPTSSSSSSSGGTGSSSSGSVQRSGTPLSIGRALVTGSLPGLNHSVADHRSKTKAPGIVSLGRTLDVALWTGGLWNGGVLVVLLFGLALLGLLSVPLLYLLGRRRGRW